MEITEVVTPAVAIPVLGVLVCAFLVFAFGFKSPGQPPSFEAFDEDSKRKRNKRSKGKSQSNGHALSIPDEGNVNTIAKPQPSPKQTKQTAKQVSSAKVKQTSQAAEQSKKVKKVAVVKEVAKEPPVAPKQQQETPDDDDGWHTIIKKDKKQKKREERGETPIEERYIAMERQPVVMEEPVALETEEKSESAPASPQEQRQKKKKEKKAKKGKLEVESQAVVPDAETEQGKDAAQEPIIDIEIIPAETPQPELEVVAENNVEHHIQDAMETHEEEEVQVVKKKSKSKKKKQSPTPEPEAAPVQPDQIQPGPVEPSPAPVDQESRLSPTEENTPVTTKSPKKKQKKERRKGNEPKSVDPEEDVGGASGSVEPSLSQSLTDVSKQTPKITELSQEVVPGPAPGAEAAAAQSPVATFDELGGLSESWTEAKPKSKKKKARREN